MTSLKESSTVQNSGYKGVGNVLEDNADYKTWNILNEGVSFPAATLSKSALNHNQSWMDKFAEVFEFQLAPHGKTTMLPDLFKLQAASPCCWGITLATVPQVAAAFKSGIKSVLLANQLVGRTNLAIIADILRKDPSFEFICLVDSTESVIQLGNFFSERKQNVKVLMEYGLKGGRTGIRNEDQEKLVVDELKKWKDTISVVGVEFFEGVFAEERPIREFIDWVLSRVEKLALVDIFSTKDVILTGAGTAWLDTVAEDLKKFAKTCSIKLKIIVRSGCYLIYDKGLYLQMEKRVLDMKLGEDKNDFKILSEPLKPALKIWAYVHSIPEPNLAIIGIGRRDVGTDLGNPVPYLHYRPGKENSPKSPNPSWKIFRVMDQHAFMQIEENSDLKVGDILAFDIYHACTTLDKWRNVLLINDDYNVLDIFTSDF